MRVSNMIKRHGFYSFDIELILCFFLGSLVVLPIVSIVSMSSPGILSMYFENQRLFEPSEFEDDFLGISFAIFIIGVQFLLKFMGVNLDFCSAVVVPVFLPPKYL